MVRLGPQPAEVSDAEAGQAELPPDAGKVRLTHLSGYLIASQEPSKAVSRAQATFKFQGQLYLCQSSQRLEA